jgi:hypothetical protein
MRGEEESRGWGCFGIGSGVYYTIYLAPSSGKGKAAWLGCEVWGWFAEQERSIMAYT